MYKILLSTKKQISSKLYGLFSNLKVFSYIFNSSSLFISIQVFSRCGKLHTATVAKKKDPRKPDSMLSMGYGFLEFKKQKDADQTVKLMQVFVVVESWY